jgi:hypothetical protein
MTTQLCGTVTNWAAVQPDIYVSRVSPDLLNDVWAEAKEFIELARRVDTTESLESIKKNIANCSYQLWIAVDIEIICTMVTMLIDRGHEKVLHVEYAGAVKRSLPAWKEPIVEALTKFGKQYGAVALECAGRVGWQAVFPEAKVISVKIRKEF